MEEGAQDDVFSHAAVYEDADGATIYRASSLGRCIGALVRARLGVTGSSPPDAMQAKFDEGHDWEQRVILAGLGVDWTQLDARKLKAYGTVVGDKAGPQVETEIRWETKAGVKVIRCHPDAIVVSRTRMIGGGDMVFRDEAGNGERRVVEAKFFGTDLFYETVRGVNAAEKDYGAGKQALGLGPSYAMQLSIEMLSTGLPALYIIGLKARATEVDVKAGRAEQVDDLMLGEVWTMEVDEPPLSLADVKARVYEVEGYVARGDMPKCVVPFDYPCPYWDSHDEKEKRPEITDWTLQMLMAEWQMREEERDTLAADMENVKAAIEARLGALGLSGGPCGGYELAVVEPTQGNVSWKSAYTALARQSKQTVDEDAYRGKVPERHVRIKKIETNDG